jgi:diguanylate cyclase (GGDEF)-like protein
MLTLYELARALAGQTSISDTGDIIAKHLRRLVPSSLCVFYIYDSAADELVAKHAMGEATSVVKGLRIQVGQRLSGWVAANRHTIANSDPTLDLGDVARSVSPRLRSCLSTPLLADDALVGVLTLYSATVDGFTEDHRRIVEVVARQIGHTFKSAVEFDNSGRRDALTGLPNSKQLEDILDPGKTGNIGHASLVLIDVRGLKHVNVTHGRFAADEAVRHVVHQARVGLRVADILFRSSSDQLIALLSDADTDTAAAVANRIRKSISDKPVMVNGSMIEIEVSVHCISAPRDGRSLVELVSAARLRSLAPTSTDSGPSVH